MNTNFNTQTVTKQASPMVWFVDCTGEVVETETHDGVKLMARDRDGKFAPSEKPVTRKQAIRKLNTKSQRLSKAIDAMQMMENW